jgi:hypothetical protein
LASPLPLLPQEKRERERERGRRRERAEREREREAASARRWPPAPGQKGKERKGRREDGAI